MANNGLDSREQLEYRRRLEEMLQFTENKYCADCGTKGPRWASTNLGVFLCLRCSGIHRAMGTHISKVKSVNLDKWQPEMVQRMAEVGNARAKRVYEARVPRNYPRPNGDQIQLEQWIRRKYERREWYDESAMYEEDEDADSNDNNNNGVAAMPSQPQPQQPYHHQRHQQVYREEARAHSAPPSPSHHHNYQHANVHNNNNNNNNRLAASSPSPAPNQELLFLFGGDSTNTNTTAATASGAGVPAQWQSAASSSSSDMSFFNEPEKPKLTNQSILSLYNNNTVPLTGGMTSGYGMPYSHIQQQQSLPMYPQQQQQHMSYQQHQQQGIPANGMGMGMGIGMNMNTNMTGNMNMNMNMNMGMGMGMGASPYQANSSSAYLGVNNNAPLFRSQ